MSGLRVPAEELEAKCMALLEHVARTGQEIRVTKRGKPVARLVPVARRGTPRPRGSVLHQGDVVSPIKAGRDARR